MKKITSLILATLSFFSFAITSQAAIPPPDLEWTCDENEIFDYYGPSLKGDIAAIFDVSFKLELKNLKAGAADIIGLEEWFNKKWEKTNVLHLCMKNAAVFILRGQNKIAPTIYHIPTQKAHLGRAHEAPGTCYIQKTSTRNRINYLCYNPAVAAGSTKGKEFSYRVKSEKIFKRSCTVFFGGEKEKQCGRWTRLNSIVLEAK